MKEVRFDCPQLPLQGKVYDVRRTLPEKNAEITADRLKASLKGTSSKERKIMQIFQKHNRQMEMLVGKDYSDPTLKRYKTSALARQFIEWKYNTHDLEIRALNYEFLSQYTGSIKIYIQP